MGPQKRRLVDPKVNECTAYHEAGHALIVYFSRDISKKLQKITILPRGHSLGMVRLPYNRMQIYVEFHLAT